MKMLPRIFRPNYEFDIIRLGTNYDGGYLVERSSMLNSKYLFSFGISTNWDFEKDFISINNIEFLALDGSVSHHFWDNLIISKIKRLSLSKAIKIWNQKISFYRFFNEKNFVSKYIGKSLPNSLSFTEVINKVKSNNIFFKIDIEGSEYEILNEILYHQNNIIGLCIEFHNCNAYFDKIQKFIKNFKLELVHIHANNYEQPLNNYFPNILEITFAKNPKVIGEYKELPHSLDMPNRSKDDDIVLKFEKN